MHDPRRAVAAGHAGNAPGARDDAARRRAATGAPRPAGAGAARAPGPQRAERQPALKATPLLGRLLLQRRRAPAQYRVARRFGFVEPAARREARRRTEMRGVAGPRLD